MPTRSSRQQDIGKNSAGPFYHVHGTQQKRVHVTTTANFLIERARANLEEAARVLPELFYHWTLRSDEVAPSAEAEFDSPENCPLSYGTGVLPGYVKHGFNTIIPIHSNRPLRGVNLFWNYNAHGSTPVLTLQDSALYGTAETDWMAINPNFGLELVNPLVGPNVMVEATFDDATWFTLDDVDFHTEFKTAPRFRTRISMARASLSDALPEMSGLIMRYQVSQNPTIRGDIPKWNFSRERDSAAGADQWLVGVLETYNAYFIHEVGSIKIGDFFEHVKTGQRFYLVSQEPLQIPVTGRLEDEVTSTVNKGGLLGNDVQVRLLQPDSPLSRIL